MRVAAFLVLAAVLAAGVVGSAARAADDPKPAAIKVYHPKTTPPT